LGLIACAARTDLAPPVWADDRDGAEKGAGRVRRKTRKQTTKARLVGVYRTATTATRRTLLGGIGGGLALVLQAHLLPQTMPAAAASLPSTVRLLVENQTSQKLVLEGWKKNANHDDDDRCQKTKLADIIPGDAVTYESHTDNAIGWINQAYIITVAAFAETLFPAASLRVGGTVSKNCLSGGQTVLPRTEFGEGQAVTTVAGPYQFVIRREHDLGRERVFRVIVSDVV
jgi:hypothetical protein